jgi:hypothetical protein
VIDELASQRKGGGLDVVSRDVILTCVGSCLIAHVVDRRTTSNNTTMKKNGKEKKVILLYVRPV